MKPKHRILFGVAAVTMGLDQLTKSWILRDFRIADSVAVVPGFFNLTYVRNSGAAFGILSQAEPAFRVPFFIIVPLLALLAIGYVFRKLPDGDLKLSTALSLVIGGALGNLIDRMRLDFVVDFVDVHWGRLHHFPAFNVADSAICVGVGVLVVDLLIRDRLGHEAGSDSSESEENPAHASSTL